MDRKEQLKQSYRDLMSQPLNKRDEAVDAFIKEEFYPEYKCPRGIYSRSDRFKVYCGPVVKAIQDIIFAHPAFIKKVPVADRPSYIKEAFDKVEGNIKAGDFKAYESHFTKDMYEMIEFEVYKYLTSNNQEAHEVMQTFMRVVSAVNKIKFSDVTVTIPATRMSGEMNTSLGNGIVNFIIINYICEVIYKTEVTAYVEGDDSIYKTLAAVTKQDYEMCGFTCELDTVETISEASFCGLVFDTENLTVIADPIKYILKTPWMMRRWMRASDKAKMGVLKSKALSLLWQFPGCPIIQSYAQYLYRNTYQYNIPKSQLEYIKSCYDLSVGEYEFVHKNQSEAIFKPTPVAIVDLRTRLLMEKVYRIPIEHQLYLEKLFDEMEGFVPFYDPIIYSHTTPEQQHFYENHIIETNIKISEMTNYINVNASNVQSQLQLYELLKDKCYLGTEKILYNLTH